MPTLFRRSVVLQQFFFVVVFFYFIFKVFTVQLIQTTAPSPPTHPPTRFKEIKKKLCHL